MVANPLQKLSPNKAAAMIAVFCPAYANQTYNKFDNACKIPKTHSARIKPNRDKKKPPSVLPNNKPIMPMVLLIIPICNKLKCMARIKKTVLSETVIASGNLYKIIKATMSKAFLRVKKVCNGATIASRRLLGACVFSDG